MTDTSTPIVEGVERRRAAPWWLHLLLGAALAGIGIALVLSPRAAASTLALLVGVGFVIHGLDDLLDPARRTGLGLVAGLGSVGAGIVSMVWPEVTLWALAVIVGMAFIALGSLKITTGLMARPAAGWSWVTVIGIASAVLGVLALCWPSSTALVLAVVFGLRTIVAGASEIAFALEVRRVTAAS